MYYYYLNEVSLAKLIKVLSYRKRSSGNSEDDEDPENSLQREHFGLINTKLERRVAFIS